ncbi:MAG: glucosylglycerol 3-phosphatase [Cyanobacteria bacterium P01_G01_bin.39]
MSVSDTSSAVDSKTQLSDLSLSLNHQRLAQMLIQTENILIIQDLDGVCMGLVKDPLTRVMETKYIHAVKALGEHFFVLTNGEHIGQRGVNGIIERTLGGKDIAKQGLYLPGLAGGGVQWQDCYGNVSHPGVSEAEMEFLEAVPLKVADFLKQLGQKPKYNLDQEQLAADIQATVLDNKVSPTANLNVFHEKLKDQPGLYAEFQQEIKEFVEGLLEESRQQGLSDSFFIHYAPNLGRDEQGLEIMQPARDQDSGTTDFQFMLRGAIKEVGVLVILNHYYYLKTGTYPLGSDFNAREAPHKQQDLLQLVKDNLDPKIMPNIVGVGDTVTSKAVEQDGQIQFKRGGSDRGFLELVQALGKDFETNNVVVYVDSSGGEVKNRQAIELDQSDPQNIKVIRGPGDSRDTTDPLTLNFVFPAGHLQYVDFFCQMAKSRS